MLEAMNDSRLYAIVFRLAAMRRGAVPGEHGDLVRSALMNLFRDSDFPLAQKLHDENAAKPYTISLLRGGKRDTDHTLHFGEGDTADWRFTLLSEPTFEALLHRYLLHRNLPHVRIGAVEFAITDAFASGSRHRDSGHVSLTELTERWNYLPESLPRTVTLDFLSPTVFNIGSDPVSHERRWRLVPDARTLFSGLRKKWIKLGGVEPGDTFDEWVQQHIELEPLELHLNHRLVKKVRVPGFCGRVRFRAYENLRWLPLVHVLADLAFWIGVGYQTTCGMGQVRRVVEEA
jgi:CRISPR-associated endoribonuclease Cas6